MYICNCKGVTENDIRRAAESGVRNMRQLRATTGCSTGCGECACQARKVLKVHQPSTQAGSGFDLFLNPA
jgi:bacterioferritin-associated ferredoxin